MEDKETLINAVFNEPAIWNKSCLAYQTKKYHKDRIWNKIAKNCNSTRMCDLYLLIIFYFVSVKWCQTTWKYLSKT